MIVRFNRPILVATVQSSSAAIGVEGDPNSHPGKISEVEKIVGDAKRKVQSEGIPGVGVSGSNSGKGHDPVTGIDGVSEEEDDEGLRRISMERLVEEEPELVEGEGRPDEVDLSAAVKLQSEETVKNLKLPEGIAKQAQKDSQSEQE